jgi:hypothetical protein
MTSVIQFYGKSFSIGFSDADNARRAAYFKQDLGTLTPQEKSLLLSIGIDAKMENTLKLYLADFFASLQTCSSDTSLILNKDCETAYFVIWAALFANNTEIARRYKQSHDHEGVMSDESLAQTGALIQGLKTRPLSGSIGSEKDMASALFKLIFIETAPEDRGEQVDSLFRLMFVETEEDDENAASNISAASTETAGARTVLNE